MIIGYLGPWGFGRRTLRHLQWSTEAIGDKHTRKSAGGDKISDEGLNGSALQERLDPNT